MPTFVVVDIIPSLCIPMVGLRSRISPQLSILLLLTAITYRLCHVHNQVNERLGHPIFDCAHLDDEYDCGCGDDPAITTTTDSPETSSGSSGNNGNEKTIIQVGDAMPGIGGLSEKKVVLTEMHVGGTGKEVVIPPEGARDVDTGAEMIRGGR